MRKFKEIICRCLDEMVEENRRLVDEIKIYKRLLYSFELDEFDVEGIKEEIRRIEDKEKRMEFNQPKTTTPIKDFLNDLLEAKL